MIINGVEIGHSDDVVGGSDPVLAKKFFPFLGDSFIEHIAVGGINNVLEYFNRAHDLGFEVGVHGRLGGLGFTSVPELAVTAAAQLTIAKTSELIEQLTDAKYILVHDPESRKKGTLQSVSTDTIRRKFTVENHGGIAPAIESANNLRTGVTFDWVHQFEDLGGMGRFPDSWTETVDSFEELSKAEPVFLNEHVPIGFNKDSLPEEVIFNDDCMSYVRQMRQRLAGYGLRSKSIVLECQYGLGFTYLVNRPFAGAFSGDRIKAVEIKFDRLVSTGFI